MSQNKSLYICQDRPIPVQDLEIADLPKEKWKAIPDFENYHISNYGRVKSISRNGEDKLGRRLLRKERILKLRLTCITKDAQPLVQMTLCKDNKDYSFAVGKMVYHLFVKRIDINDRSVIIKKKNNNPLDCHYKNLELYIPKYDNGDKINNSSCKAVYPATPILNTSTADLNDEQWKVIPDFDEKYQISNYGRIKSVKRTIVNKDGYKVTFKERIHRLGFSSRGGSRFSVQVVLMRGNEPFKFSIPRLVYSLFVAPFDIQDYTLLIDKKDNNDLNCHCDNLVLTTSSNVIMEAMLTKGVENIMHNVIKPVNQYDQNGNFLERFTSLAAASTDTGIKIMQIRNAINRNQLQGKKYYWQFGQAQKKIDLSQYQVNSRQYLSAIQTPVQQLSPDGRLIAVYPSIRAATKAMGLKSHNSIGHACAKENAIAKGFLWRLVPGEKPGNKAKRPNKARKVHQYDATGTFIRTYKSALEASKNNQIVPSAISNAARLKYKTAKGFYWRYGSPKESIEVSAYTDKRKQHQNSGSKRIQKLSLDNEPLEIYESLSAAANAIKGSSSAIRLVCNNETVTYKRFKWRYVEAN